MGFGVEDRRVAVGVGEAFGGRPLGQCLDLGEDAACGVLVQIAELAGFEDLLNLQELEEVELEVAEVALVMAHVVGVSQCGAVQLASSTAQVITRR